MAQPFGLKPGHIYFLEVLLQQVPLVGHQAPSLENIIKHPRLTLCCFKTSINRALTRSKPSFRGPRPHLQGLSRPGKTIRSSWSDDIIYIQKILKISPRPASFETRTGQGLFLAIRKPSQPPFGGVQTYLRKVLSDDIDDILNLKKNFFRNKMIGGNLDQSPQSEVLEPIFGAQRPSGGGAGEFFGIAVFAPLKF